MNSKFRDENVILRIIEVILVIVLFPKAINACFPQTILFQNL